MKISSEGEEITKRFFIAIDKLIELKYIRGVKTLSTKYNINYWNFKTLKKEPSKRILKPEYIRYIVNDYGVSANWIITGKGAIFDKSDNVCE